MSSHRFQLRASYRYRGDHNEIDSLDADILTDDGWQALDLGLSTPGFLIFVYSFLVCQHTYFHANCTESEIRLESAVVELLLLADEDWKIDRIGVEITASLRDGEPGLDTIDYVESRMRQCPVSINLVEPAAYSIDILFR